MIRWDKEALYFWEIKGFLFSEFDVKISADIVKKRKIVHNYKKPFTFHGLYVNIIYVIGFLKWKRKRTF